MNRYKYNGKEVGVECSSYRYDGSLALLLRHDGGEEDVVSVNLRSIMQSEHMCFLDINNYPGIERFLSENRLGASTGFQERSGFCTYPLWVIYTDLIGE